MMKGQCMPRFRSCSTKNKSPSPMSLLERFREAVFRLMMLSALSKATANNQGGSGDSGRQRRRYYSYQNDPHHSEAVADCIEFIKKKATVDDNRHSSVSSCSSVEVIQVPVM
ncbi:hypothetical protein L6164_027636 [Bauhinia variegata]|uniref:Uncharacterized protein n=1 Tax=Bauhinia variegata TaxID=167791 RepID=A0ACB9LUY3_BAUVA|nr:hypothetical protein L6164_027636 [Bauhinia variegata]